MSAVGNVESLTAEPKYTLALFFSHGITLTAWEQGGLFDREVGYYRELSSRIGPVLFVTYDQNSSELRRLLERLRPLEAVYNRWGLHYWLFGLLAPLLHRKALLQCTIFKTNQLSGAWTGAIAKRILGKPLMVRCGYVWSRNVRRRRASCLRSWLVLLIERVVLQSADVVLLATEEDKAYVTDVHRVSGLRVAVLPNPIDTERFRPNAAVCKERGLIIFVGRLEQEKNLELLLEAMGQIPGARLKVVGIGSLQAKLRAEARHGKIEFCGMIPNRELPHHLNEAEVFVLPSSYEGNPKALLEAMACGLGVIGTDVPGIRGVIRHGFNGLLCEADPDTLSEGIRRLLSDTELSRRLGEQARRFVVENYSQSRVAHKEVALIKKIVAMD